MSERFEHVIGQVLRGLEAFEVDPREWKVRTAVLARLFAVYREPATEGALLDLYVSETAEIPLGILSLACKAMIQTRVYPDLPRIGALFEVARKVAGMHREQYAHGRYLPPPRDWPPEGKRYAITVGEYERLPKSVPERWLTDGGTAPQIGPGENA